MSFASVTDFDAYPVGPGPPRAGATGKHGTLEMEFDRRGDRSVLTHLYRQAPLVVQQALYWDEYMAGMPCIFIITTSGCVLQDDRLDVAITIRPGAMAHITTQAATKIHQMTSGYAAQTQNVRLGERAYLELLPGPVIPHRHSRFTTHTSATVAATATLLTAEVLAPGRMHHDGGELFEYDLYASSLTVARPEGAPLCAEKMTCEPRRHPVGNVGQMEDFKVVATVTLVTPPANAEAVLQRVQAGMDVGAGCIAGASRLPNAAGLVYKVLGHETEPVRAAVREFWKLARGEVLGAPVPEPRTWG